ncbi:MAG: ABC transporter substrate-binding protein [bacterium]
MKNNKLSEFFKNKIISPVSILTKKVWGGGSLTERFIYILLIVVLILSGLTLVWKVNQKLLKEIPAKGGSLTEGIIGSPRFINPLLELSDADRDLTYLVYSGLLRANPSGELVPDLAESYSVSDDGMTFNFKLKDNIYFHDGVKVTADDVEYTILMAQDVNLRSPKRNNWDSKTVSVKKINDREIEFDLKQSYPGFLENMTMGILPKHIWSNASTDEFSFSTFNTDPIGSGPYQISSISRNKSGIPTTYSLTAFKRYGLGEPYITNLNINFYSNEKSLLDAYTGGQVDAVASVSPDNMPALLKSTNPQIEQITLPRIFGLFFNQNQNKIFINKEVRQALNMTVDKDKIVQEVLLDYGMRADSPIPPSLTADKILVPISDFDKDKNLTSAKALLAKNGWKFSSSTGLWTKAMSKKETQTLQFSISTSNGANLSKIATMLKEMWEPLGIKVDVKTFDQGDLNQSVISQRNYDALLFGEVIGRNMDMFPFWHSSQRNYPGNNIAIYTNPKADALLEAARKTTDDKTRISKYQSFINEVNNDIPAIFIYSPDLIYLLPKDVKGFAAGLIVSASERFENIQNWYIETDRVWKFLTK